MEVSEASLDLKKLSDNIIIPSGIPMILKPYNGFDFNTIETDLLGVSRKDDKVLGQSLGKMFLTPIF